ncbi:MAG TPA: VWA domain-containing protein [Actinomycetota bacterium]
MLEFGRALRSAGVPVAVSENLDALRALEHVRLDDKDSMRAALATTMVKDQGHMQAFDTLFDLYFGTGRGPDAIDARDENDEPTDRDDLVGELADALGDAGGSGLQDIARRAVAQFGRLQSSSSGTWYSQYQVLRTLDLDALVEMLRGRAEADDTLTPMERRLRLQEIERRVQEFRRLTLNETRRRVAEHDGPEKVASYAVSPLPEDLSFLSATSDMAELRRAVRPLARKLATRVAMKRRRARRGNLDLRRTVRRSLSSGGVPFDTAFRHRAPHRPELVVLCDVSSSVSRFARFALMLTHALSAQFSRVRSFAFVDTLDEVTHFFDHEDFLAAVDRMYREASVVHIDGHSDYGASLVRLHDVYGAEIGPRTTLLILGDARNNYRAPEAWALKALRASARHTYWLNPEPVGDWDTGDSVASTYAACVDKMVEVRNLRQLEDFIALAL